MPDPLPPIAPDAPAPTAAPKPAVAGLLTPPPSVTLRRFGDHAATRQAIFAHALEAARQIQPAKNARYELALTDPKYVGPDSFTPAEHKAALLENRTLGRRLTATAVLKDAATGAEVGRKQTTLAVVPYLTDHGTFVTDGSPAVLASQMRLLPGVYTRRKESGEVESHVNSPQEGVSHRLRLDPETGVFKVDVGQAEIPAAPLLQALGVTPDEMAAAWGHEVAAANLKAAKPHHLTKLLEKFGPAHHLLDPDPAKQQAALADALGKLRFDPWVTKRTLGIAADRYTKDVALAATKKTLDVFRRRTDPDDRDSLVYSSVWAPEHLVGERIRRTRLMNDLWRVTNRGTLDAMGPGAAEGNLRSLFLSSGLGQTPDGVSAAEYIDHGARITKVGEGGLGRSADSVPRSSRDVSPSHFLFIDPSKVPECHDGETEVMTASGWKRWDAVMSDDHFACRVGGRLEFHPASALHVSDYAGPMYGAENGFISYLVTPNHRMWVRPSSYPNAEWRWSTAEETHDKSFQVSIAGHRPFEGDMTRTTFTLPDVAKGSNSQLTYGPYVIEEFAELLGWYLGEGSTRQQVTSSGPQYATVISQCKKANPANCERLEKLLHGLGLADKYVPGVRGYLFTGKQLQNYFQQFGTSQDRYIPEEFLSAPAEARTRLADALMLAEGRRLPEYKARAGERLIFTTTSPKLAEAYARLLFSLGFASGIRKCEDKRGFLPVFEVTKFRRNVRNVDNKTSRTDGFVRQFVGKVYCATVPGGMLYTRRNGRNGFWSGNSESVGVDLRVAFGTRVGSDNRIYAPVRDVSTSKIVYRSSRDLADEALAFPVTYEQAGPNDQVPAVVNGRLDYVTKKDVKYVAPSMEQAFSPLSNLVPGKAGVKPQRASMGARFISQSLPVINADAPYVRSQVPGQPGKSFEELYGRHMGAVVADASGVVEKVKPDQVVVRKADGQVVVHDLHQNLPVGRKSAFNQTPLVTPGQPVRPGQVLAKSNYTDANGHAAYGLNARVAYYPYLRAGFHPGAGATYEDAIVVSKAFADRLTSDHLYREDFDTRGDPDVMVGKAAFTAAFPGRLSPDKLKNYDDTGHPKPGAVVEEGDPLVLAVKRKAGGYGVGRTRSAGLAEAGPLWEHDTPGTVTDTAPHKHGVNLTVHTLRPMKSGDKASGRYGNKGVVHVVDTDHMPVGEDGKPFDVLMSPLGIISRINPTAKIELALGKVAAHTGKPELMPDFGQVPSLARYAAEKLRQYGLKSSEAVTDPVTGRVAPRVATGNMYLMRLHHLADDKVKSRGLGSYDEFGQPMRGQAGKAARMSLGDTNALLAYNADEVLKDARLYRGQQNEEFWLAYQGGYPPTRPAAYQQFDRFLDRLRGAGVNPVRDGVRTHLFPLTRRDLDRLAGDREITVPATVDAGKDHKPVPGGLFDPDLVGTEETPKWAKITLHQPYPSPVYEEPIRRLLGMTEKEYRAVIAGNQPFRGQTGPAAVVTALKSLDVDKELAAARAQFESSRKTHREEAARKLGYLKALARTGRTPADWVTHAVPVLPPQFRPVRESPGRGLMVADANVLYSDLIHADQAVRGLEGRVGNLGDERLAVYDAVKAAYGLGDPVNPKSAQKEVKGVLAHVFGGGQSKRNVVIQKLLGTPADLSGRGVVLPNHALDLDQAGIPEAMAWDLYTPFTVRRLVRAGVGRVEALRRVQARDPMARKALQEEMLDRPVVMTRYPVLHKYSTQAFRPVLVPGSSIHTNPLVNKSLGLDHDGDTMSVHVPLSDGAVKQALERMLPSRNLYSPATFDPDVFAPNMEFVQGLHALSAAHDAGRPPVVFETRADALAALKKGEIGPETPVHVLRDDRRPTPSA